MIFTMRFRRRRCVPAEWEVEKLRAFLKGKHQEKHA
jgi:hypothetical protein